MWVVFKAHHHYCALAMVKPTFVNTTKRFFFLKIILRFDWVLMFLGVALCFCIVPYLHLPSVQNAFCSHCSSLYILRGLSKHVTLMPTSSPKLTKLLCLCKCPSLPLCYTLVISPLLLGVGYGFNLISFWGLFEARFMCPHLFHNYEPSNTKSNKLFTYLLIKLLEI